MTDLRQAEGNPAAGPAAEGRGPQPKAKTRVWVQNVDVNVSVLEARLDALRARRTAMRSRGSDRGGRLGRRWEVVRDQLDADEAVDQHARQLLDRARKAAHRKDPVPNRIMNWWDGRLIEAAYQNLHAAEALMASLYGWDELEAEIPEAVARVEAGLHRDDPRRSAAYGLGRLLGHQRRDAVPLSAVRADLSKAIEVGHGAADREHSRLRSFRNAVLAAGVLIGLLVVVFGVYAALNHEKVPLCFTPTNAEGAPATWVCPTGEYPWDADTPTRHGPTSPHDMLVVALLGLLGGAFSAAISIKGLTGASTPYDVPLALALLKLPLGALTSVGALIALQGDFVPGLSELDSQGQILAYALVFGYAQQLLSGLLDRRAQSLLAAAPGKDKDVAHLAGHAAPVASAPATSAATRRGTAVMRRGHA